MAWLSGWTKRIKLTIDNTKVDSALSHFPVTVFLSSTHGDCVFDELTADANRKKIAVTQSDGTTQLYCEIEKWDDVNESAILHISKTGWSISSSADTDFYLYYLSTQAENTTYIGDIASTPAASVWDSSSKMVQHMVDDTTSTVLDSTSNNNDGTKTSADNPLEAVGKVGKGQDFDGGTSDEVAIAAATSINALGDFTFSAAVNFPALGSNYAFVFCDKDTGAKTQLRRSSNKLHCYLLGSAYDSTDSISAGDHFVAVTRSGTTLSLYSDGALLNSWTVVSTALSSSGYAIGKYKVDNTLTLDGIISEAGISNTARNLAWIKATYNSLWDTLLTYGIEDELGVVCGDITADFPSFDAELFGGNSVAGTFPSFDCTLAGANSLEHSGLALVCSMIGTANNRITTDFPSFDCEMEGHFFIPRHLITAAFSLSFNADCFYELPNLGPVEAEFPSFSFEAFGGSSVEADFGSFDCSLAGQSVSVLQLDGVTFPSFDCEAFGGNAVSMAFPQLTASIFDHGYFFGDLEASFSAFSCESAGSSEHVCFFEGRFPSLTCRLNGPGVCAGSLALSFPGFRASLEACMPPTGDLETWPVALGRVRLEGSLGNEGPLEAAFPAFLCSLRLDSYTYSILQHTRNEVV